MKHRLIEASVVLAMSSVFGTGAAAATETLQLTCESTNSTGATNYRTVKVRVDFDNQIVAVIVPSGVTIASTTDRRMNALPPIVEISDGAVKWYLANSIGIIFRGLLNRETGDVEMLWYEPQGTYANAPLEIKTFGGRCRRATQKF